MDRVRADLPRPLAAVFGFILEPYAAQLLWPALAGLGVAALLGAPIFVVLGGAALVLFYAEGVPVAAIPVETYRIIVSPTLPTIPLFTLTGRPHNRGRGRRIGTAMVVANGRHAGAPRSNFRPAGSGEVKMQTVGTVFLGIDIGSTTVKCVVVEPDGLDILWSRYERHETRQAEKVAEMLAAIERAFPDTARRDIRAFITGSGAGLVARHIGARFVQEVNAVALAVERLHADAGSVIELGGQDAKIIIFKEQPETGERQVISSMNDK